MGDCIDKKSVKMSETSPKPAESLEGIEITQEKFCEAVRDELISHFCWTDAEGFVRSQADQVARNAFRRFLDGQIGQSAT